MLQRINNLLLCGNSQELEWIWDIIHHKQFLNLYVLGFVGNFTIKNYVIFGAL